ncbi:MAG: BON domain-containing protein [Chloroflexota bacterium]
MIHKLQKPPDILIRSEILTQFASDERIANINLRVGVVNGIAHLAGVVSSIEIRSAAADLASDVQGVRGVVNRIEAPGAPSPGRSINLILESDKENIDYE